MKNLKKNFKKITTLFMLSLTIIMSMPANVLAETLTSNTTGSVHTVEFDDKNNPTTTVKVKISGIESSTNINDVEINTYRIIDVNIDNTTNQPKDPVYTWNYQVEAWMNNYTKDNGKTYPYKSYIGTKTKKDANNNSVHEVAAKFCDANQEGATGCIPASEVKTFYDDLANAIKTSNDNSFNNVPKTIFKNNTWDESTDSKTTTISGLTLGNYLVLIEKGMNVYQPSAINVVPKSVKKSTNPDVYEWVVEDSELTVKYTTPSIDKLVEGQEQSTVAIGDTVTYTIEVVIPKYPDNAVAKNIIIRDKFSEGLTFKEITKIELLDVSGNATSIKDNQKLDVKYNGTDTTNNEFAKYDFMISFTKDNYDVIENGEKLRITYTGIVNDKAKIGAEGNDNTAVLKYNRNPYDDNWYKTDDHDVKVYTYGAKLKKVNADGGTILPGAEFSISKDNNDTVGETIKFVLVTDASNGATKYRKATTEEITNDNITKYETNLVVPESGILVLDGLDEGTYWITETKAPEGFVKLQNPIKITITAQTDSSTGKLNGKVNDDKTVNANEKSDDEYYELKIENSNSTIVLPVTGGIGTLLFSVIGILFMGLGAFLIKNILKKEDVQ